VKLPDVDDYKKMCQVMQYLHATKLMSLTLEADSTNVIKWWVDAAYAIHSNIHSHTGGAMRWVKE